MADVISEKKDTAVVEKVAADGGEVDAKKDATPAEKVHTSENGSAKNNDVKHQNGANSSSEAPADASERSEEEAAADDGKAEENGDKPSSETAAAAEEANGDSTASEPLKRKVTADGDAAKPEEAAAVTPEKKAKLDEATKKEGVRNGSEASEATA